MGGEAEGLRGRRILVVEDESLVSMMIEDILAGLGCVVIGPAATAAAAVALIEQEPIDCAVLDVGLADGPVFPLADALAARGVPFIFATGYFSGSLDRRYAAVPLVGKPFDIGELKRAIAAALDRRPDPSSERRP